jgi:hypothetical protein
VTALACPGGIDDPDTTAPRSPRDPHDERDLLAASHPGRVAHIGTRQALDRELPHGAGGDVEQRDAAAPAAARAVRWHEVREGDAPAVRRPRGIAVESLGMRQLGELARAILIDVHDPQPGVAVPLSTKDHAAAIRGERRVQVLGRVAHGVRDRPGITPRSRDQPELPQQVEHDRPAVRGNIEAKCRALVHLDGDGLGRGGGGRCRDPMRGAGRGQHEDKREGGPASRRRGRIATDSQCVGERVLEAIGVLAVGDGDGHRAREPD